MKVNLESIKPEEVKGHFEVTVSCWDDNNTPHNSAKLTFFVPAADSISQIGEAAFQRCIQFIRATAEHITQEKI